ncbi:hypothetical protein ACFVUH_11230 [Kitasatospora sp. NPDC058032]|uniref:hypothetical protein n=1 Tax=Kitasatospora sp. NPDC058032 TaxID=3346307 RepID=UPI0036DEFD5C
MAKTATPANGVRTAIVRLGITAALALVPLMTTVNAQAAPAVKADKGNHLSEMSTTGGASAVLNDGTVTAPGIVSTSLSSGTLTFWSENGSWHGSSSYSALTAIQYKKNSGGQILARFSYQEGGNTHYDQGAFYQNAGETKSYSWGFVSLPANCSAVGQMWVSGQQTFQTPPDHPC